MRLHVIPVPRGYSVEDAWMEIQVFGCLRRRWWQRLFRTRWAVVEEEVRG